VRVRVCLKAYLDTNQISLQVVEALGDPSPGNVASYVSTVRHSLFKVQALRYPESVCVLRGLDDGYGCRGPEVVRFASKALGVELIVLGIELEGDVSLFFVGHHQIQVLASRASHEGGFARI